MVDLFGFGEVVEGEDGSVLGLLGVVRCGVFGASILIVLIRHEQETEEMKFVRTRCTYVSVAVWYKAALVVFNL